MPPSAQNYGKSSAGKDFVGGYYKSRGIDPSTVFQNTNETARRNKLLEKAVKSVQTAQAYNDQNNTAWRQVALKGPDFAKTMYEVLKGTAASFSDVIQRSAPAPIPGAPFTLEEARNALSGVKNVVTGDKNVPLGTRFKQGFYESKGRKTNFEKVTAKSLTKTDGSIDWKVGREFIGRAMEAPTYAYAGAVQGARFIGRGLVTRLAGRTAMSLPEAGINTGIQAFEEGNTENVGVNLLANAILISGVSNIAGEFQVNKKIYKEAIGAIQRELGIKLSPDEQADIVLAINQKVAPKTILENIRRIREGDVTPEELADTINRNYTQKDVDEMSDSFGSSKTTEKSESKVNGSEPKVNDEDAAFVAAVEERFKKSKTNKFRETKDEKGRFTGSTKQSGDADRDDLASSIENRINAIPDNSVENFGYREDLRAIQTKVANAKPADLPALKAQSDRIAQEILDNRAKKIRPKVDKERKIAFTRTVANESDNFNEFQLNLKKRGEDITTIFKSKAAAEEFFRKNSGAKYRTEDPLLQEARKRPQDYASAEEFVKAQRASKAVGKTAISENSVSANKAFESFDRELRAKYGGDISKISQTEKSEYDSLLNKALESNPVTPRKEPTIPTNDAGVSGDMVTGTEYFHATTADRLPSITEKGLLLNNEVAPRGKMGDRGDGVVFVSDSPEHALGFIDDLKNEKLVPKEAEPVLLRARDLPHEGLTYDSHGRFNYRAEGGAYTYDSGIPAKYLEIKRGDKWYPLQTKSQLTDLYNKAQGSKFRDIGARFEELTGKKLSPAQEAQIKALHQKMFGDDGIEITAQILTPEGHKAFGVYKNKVIKILDGQADPTDTFYHEAVHKYLDLFTTLDEQKRIYLEARKLWKTDNLDELEEKIAENFIRYAKTNEGVVGTMKVLFDQVIDRIKVALKGESQIEALYKDILGGKAKKAAEAPAVTPGKVVSPLAKRIEQTALTKRLDVDFDDLAEMTPQNRKEQAELSAELMMDKQKTLDVLDGFTPLPDGMSGAALSKAVELHGDAQMINALKRSKILSDVSQGASEQSMRVGIGEDSVIRAIKKAEDAKKSVVKDASKKVAEAKVRVKRNMPKRTLNIKKASDLLDILMCK